MAHLHHQLNNDMKDFFKDLFENINAYRVMLVFFLFAFAFTKCSTNQQMSKMSTQMEANNRKLDSLSNKVMIQSAITASVLDKVDKIENTTYQLAGSISKINPHVNIRIKKDVE